MNETVKLGVPFAPSIVTNRNEYTATSITLSWGGGMGGCCQTLYTKKKIDLKDLAEPFIKIKTVANYEVILSTRHIVKLGNVKIVELDIYNKGNQYMGEIGSTYRYVYVFPIDTQINYTSEHICSSDIKHEMRYKVEKEKK